MARRATEWFTEEGRPILNQGLYKNAPDGDFLFDFRYRGRHVKESSKTKNEQEARARKKGITDRMDAEYFGHKDPVAPTLKKLWGEWDRLHANLSESHLRWMRNVVFLHATAYLDRPATDLNVAAYEELRILYLSTKGKGYRVDGKETGKSTVRNHSEGGWNKVAGQLRALYRWAVERGDLRKVPFAVEVLPVSLEAKGVIWPEQVQRFLAVVDGIRKVRKGDPVTHASISIRLMLGAGLRESEALHMEWDRIDWRNHTLTVAQAITTGQKVKDRTVRSIPMVGWLEAFLLKWWVHCKRPTKGLLMVSKVGEVHLPGATNTAMEMGAEALGITGLTPHSCRYTFATNLFETGTRPSQIQQMLGHDKIETTMGYIIQRPKDQAESLEIAAAAMGFPSASEEVIPIRSPRVDGTSVSAASK